MKKRTIIIVVLVILGAAVVIPGSFLIYRPSETKSLFERITNPLAIKNDAKRVYALRNLKSTVLKFYTTNGTLPLSINEIVDLSAVNHYSFTDPVTERPYDYRVLSDFEQKRISLPPPFFEICSTFEAPSPLVHHYTTTQCEQDKPCTMDLYDTVTNPIDPKDTDHQFWGHDKGYDCWIFDTNGNVVSSTTSE